MTHKLKPLSAIILTGLIMTAALLPPAAIQAQVAPASASPSPVDVGLLNDKAKVLAKPSDPFDVVYGILSGEVKVAVTVSEKGDVIKAVAVSGDAKLRSAAVTAAEASKFAPYLVKGKPAVFSGFLLFNFGAAEKDKAALDEAIKLLADQQKEFLAKAQQLYDKSDYAGVIKFIDSNNKDKLDTAASELRAYANFSLNQYDEALKDITKSIDLSLGVKPLRVSYKYTLRGDIYKAQSNYVLAEADYRRALEIDPNNPFLKDKLNSLSVQKSEELNKKFHQLIDEFNPLSATYTDKANAQLTIPLKNGSYDTEANCKMMIELDDVIPPLETAIDKLEVMYKSGDIAKVASVKDQAVIKQIVEELKYSVFKRKLEVSSYINNFQCRSTAKKMTFDDLMEAVGKDQEQERRNQVIKILKNLGTLAGYFAAGQKFNALTTATPAAEICRVSLDFKKESDIIEPELTSLFNLYEEFGDIKFDNPDIAARAKKTLELRTQLFLPRNAELIRIISKYGCK